ncbi:MAG: ankyrin repeat domain-containing protein [Bacteroidota bacterium]
MSVFEAIKNHDLRFLYNYLKSGQNPNICDPLGYGLLHSAIHEGTLDLVDMLLRHGASAEQEDQFGNKPLQVACLFAKSDVVELLLAYDAYIDGISPKRPWTPLMIAVNERNDELATLLIEQGANVSFVEEEEGWTPFLVACDTGLKDVGMRLIREGVDLGAHVRSGDIAGRSAIHLVAYNGEVDLAEALVEKGVDVNSSPVGGGLSPLHWAVYNDHLDLLDFLLEKGADTNLPASGIYDNRTPLHYAVSCNRIHMLAPLLDHGADPLRADIEGRTPLDIAWQFYKEGQKSLYRDFIALIGKTNN